MRKLPDWIEAYMEFTENTEPAKAFHPWVAISTLGSVLQKKIGLDLGRFSVHPNLYIILIGPAAAPRKSLAIDMGLDLIESMPNVTLSADSTSARAFLDALENSLSEVQKPDGTIMEHCSLTIISRELQSFLGRKTENAAMLVYLTDLFDAKDRPWEYQTRHCGKNIIPSPFLNILGATTPESLFDSLPTMSMGAGLTSRMLFIWANAKYKAVPYPILTPRETKLRENLIHDLYYIHQMKGNYKINDADNKWWGDWYTSYDASNSGRICSDSVYDSWYERKPLHILKASICRAASLSNKLVIQKKHIEWAISLVEQTEHNLDNVFKNIGKSDIVMEIDIILKLIEKNKFVSEAFLLSETWRDIDATKFNNVVETLMKQKKISRSYIGPNGEKGNVWYQIVNQKSQ